jgi:hypothetical protein
LDKLVLSLGSAGPHFRAISALHAFSSARQQPLANSIKEFNFFSSTGALHHAGAEMPDASPLTL